MNLNLISKIENSVLDYLEALTLFNQNIIQISEKPIILRKDFYMLKKKVVILSGGGSGHEPAQAGFVGKGMLTAAVSGGVFASPPPNVILDGIFEISRKNTKGVLLIVFNYTGDRINFNIAAERARKLGICVEIVLVGEDVALESVNKACGRRGLSGTIFIHKIAGAMADKDYSLNEIKMYLDKILEPGIMGTIGISFSRNVHLIMEHSLTETSDDFYELGLGIHGEAGVHKKQFHNTESLIKDMVNHLTNSGVCHVKLSKGDKIVLLINNLGSCAELELFSFANSVRKYLETEYQVTVVRGYCGNYVTSLHMYGVSISILKIIHDSILEYLDYPVSAPGWKNLVYKYPISDYSTIPCSRVYHKIEEEKQLNKCEGLSKTDILKLEKVIIAACDALIKEENYLNDLDREIGDSDCGTTFKRGALAVKQWFCQWNNENSVKFVSQFLSELSIIIENSMGGSSGGLLSLFFDSVSRMHHENPNLSWSHLFLESTNILSNVGGAVEGDRTMLDVLFPIFKFWSLNNTESIENILLKLNEIAKNASLLTIKMKPKAGRASYVTESDLFDKNPDAGAEAIRIIIQALNNVYSD